jgi:hypothetical protein
MMPWHARNGWGKHWWAQERVQRVVWYVTALNTKQTMHATKQEVYQGKKRENTFKLKESHAQHQAHWLERMMYKRVQAGPIMGPNLHTSFVTLQ